MSDMTTTAQANLEAQGAMGEIVISGDYDRLSEVLADTLVDHDPAPGQPAGPAGIAAFWSTFHEAFPDVAISPVEVIATDDFVTAVLDVTGTHQGDFLGHPATGRSFTVRGIQVGRFVDGKMTDRWGATDQAGILEQLGLS